MARKKTVAKIATRTDPVIEWLEGTDSLTLVQLHYPNDPDRQRWLFSMIEAAFLAGRLPAVSWRTVNPPQATALALGMADHEAFLDRDDDPRTIRRTLPVISREAYRDWPDRPALPPDSPLNAWLGDDPPEQLTKLERQIRAILAAIDAEGLDRMAVPLKRKAALKEKLRTEQPALFTPSAFDRAWNEASSTGRLSIANKDRYRPR